MAEVKRASTDELVDGSLPSQSTGSRRGTHCVNADFSCGIWRKAWRLELR